MATGTDRFGRHVKGSNAEAPLPRLIPEANFSRNVSFHVIQDAEGNDLWIGRYLYDLIEVIAVSYPNGCVVEIDGILYALTVAPVRRTKPDG